MLRASAALLAVPSAALVSAGSAALAQSTKAVTTSQAAAPSIPVKPAAPAPVGADPAATSASYGDWVLRCQRVGEGDKAQRLCEVSQTVQLQNQRDPVAEIAMGHLPNDPALRLTAALPPSVSFPSTVEIASTASGSQPVQLQWRRCVPGGCFADALPSDEVVKAWRAVAGAGKLTFKDAGGRDVSLPMSFRGLAQALDALAKS